MKAERAIILTLIALILVSWAVIPKDKKTRNLAGYYLIHINQLLSKYDEKAVLLELPGPKADITLEVARSSYRKANFYRSKKNELIDKMMERGVTIYPRAVSFFLHDEYLRVSQKKHQSFSNCSSEP